MKKRFLIGLIIFGVQRAFSADVIDMTYEGVSESKRTSDARQEIMDRATEDLSLKYISEIIGKDKVEKNKVVIMNKIVGNSGKYIPFIKVGAIESLPQGKKISVQLKLSLGSLRNLLLQEGLLYKIEGPPKVLPVISMVDRVNSMNFYWWVDRPTKEKRLLIREMNQFLKALKDQMKVYGFFGLSPVQRKFQMAIPEVYRSENLRSTDHLFIGTLFKSSIIVRGEIKWTSKPSHHEVYLIHVKLAALHTGNGRSIGEIERLYETEPGVFEKVIRQKMSDINEDVVKDLALQLHEAWKRGTFGADLLKLTLDGRMSYQQLEDFKKILLSEVREIKGLRERLFEPGRVTFEVDTSSGAEQLARRLKGKKFPKFKVQVDRVRSDRLALSVKSW